MPRALTGDKVGSHGYNHTLLACFLLGDHFSPFLAFPHFTSNKPSHFHYLQTLSYLIHCIHTKNFFFFFWLHSSFFLLVAMDTNFRLSNCGGDGYDEDGGEELELGLGLSLTSGAYAPSSNGHQSQVVGWPPVKTYRMNSFNQAKFSKNEEEKGVGGNDTTSKKKKVKSHQDTNDENVTKETGHSGFVKVNMDGLTIGRKVDLNAHDCYETLAHALEVMFLKASTSSPYIRREKQQRSRLLDGSSEFVLTYEDKEGDWMLVGDVPWRMFLSTVKRLRIMKTSDANGLSPRYQEKNQKPKR